MEEAIASPVLQLGALGAVIVFMVYYMRQVQRQNEKRAEADEFIRGLVERAFEVGDAHLESWRDMTRQTIEAYQQVGAAYEEMNGSLQANCDAIRDGRKMNHAEHQTIDNNVVNLRRALDGLERTVVDDHKKIKGVISG